jgi:hypothetical protein
MFDVKGVCVPVLTCNAALQRSLTLMECCEIDIKFALRRQVPAWMSMTSELSVSAEDFVTCNLQRQGSHLQGCVRALCSFPVPGMCPRWHCSDLLSSFCLLVSFWREETGISFFCFRVGRERGSRPSALCLSTDTDAPCC